MDSKQVVLAKHPQAVAHQHKSTVDAILPHERYAHWSVCDGPEIDSRMIGVSMSEEGAWQDAAATVRADAAKAALEGGGQVPGS